MKDLMELLYTRRTYRRFEQKAIPAEVVDDILTAGRIYPSAANRQPISYVVVQNPELVQKVFDCTRWAGYLPEELGTPKEGERPTMFIVVLQNLNISKSSDTDAGLAIGNMTLAAWNHGVGNCIIGSVTRETLSKLLGLTEEEKIHSVVAFGYPTHTSTVVDVEQDGDIKYYLDEKRNYLVPKRRLEDMVRFFS